MKFDEKQQIITKERRHLRKLEWIFDRIILWIVNKGA